MVLQYSKLLYSKVSNGFLLQDSQSPCSFGKVQNVSGSELSEEKSVTLKKDLIFTFQIYFSASFAFHFLVSDT